MARRSRRRGLFELGREDGVQGRLEPHPVPPVIRIARSRLACTPVLAGMLVASCSFQPVDVPRGSVDAARDSKAAMPAPDGGVMSRSEDAATHAPSDARPPTGPPPPPPPPPAPPP